jgi:hypothetical protein
MWATTAQQSSQHAQVTISPPTPSPTNNTILSTFLPATPTPNRQVPCAPLPTNISSNTKDVPSAPSASHRHHIPPGSLCYSNDPIPLQHLSDFVTQMDIPSQCTHTTMHSSPPGINSVATTVAAYHLHTVVRVKGLIHLTGLPAQSAAPISRLADTGANCCLCQDETMLVGVHSITPVPIGVATSPKHEANISYCNKMGYLPLTCTDDSIHMQPLYCTPKASGIIMSPECIMVTSPDIVKWVQMGHRDKDESVHLVFLDKDESVVLKLDLHKRDGLYYSWMDSYTTDHNPIRVHTVHGPQSTPLPHLQDTQLSRSESPPHLIEDSDNDDNRSVLSEDISIDLDSSSVVEVVDDINMGTSQSSYEVPPTGSSSKILPTKPTKPSNPAPARVSAGRRVSHQQPRPVSPKDYLLAELWEAFLGHCEEWQLQVIPQHATGLPTSFQAHPMRYIDHKVQACIRKRCSCKTASKATKPRQCFYVNFGFMQASTSNYSKPNPEIDRIVTSVDGFTSYLLVVDKFS